MEALPERAGRIDVLVANAALPASGPTTRSPGVEVDRALDVNLRAPLHLARELAGPMVDRGSGHLVFISSLSGKTASPGSSLYSATKFGLRGYALGLREDLVGTGVGVTTVFPGFIRDAGMFHDSKTELPKGVGTRTPDQVAAGVIRGIERNQPEVDVAPLDPAAGVDRGRHCPGRGGGGPAEAGQPRRGGAAGAGPGRQALTARCCDAPHIDAAQPFRESRCSRPLTHAESAYPRGAGDPISPRGQSGNRSRRAAFSARARQLTPQAFERDDPPHSPDSLLACALAAFAVLALLGAGSASAARHRRGRSSCRLRRRPRRPSCSGAAACWPRPAPRGRSSA